MASVRAKLLMMFLVALVVAQTQVGEVRAQSCSTQMAGLNVCAPFVVPGTNKGPSAECCGALQVVEHDCLCSTLRVATSLPSACHLPPVSCDSM
ncbi:stamen-specific protein FIL1 [Rhodamnia argentea]|uniref:Stamen-specific protein FIL1 n=1 Tax=Rhodamnia argentea TaxID=178133 RepID=A0A8B8P6H1_9MYRT|nr:stamen-specific protein FIL1 [Rhodamnia argentea]